MKNLFATAASVLALGFALPATAQQSYSNVQQIGANQTATVDQTGATANNWSYVNQGVNPASASADNEATVTQLGTGLIENISTVNQDGNDNVANVRQEGAGFDLGYNSSLTTQVGKRNDVDIKQHGTNVVNNISDATQTGDDNEIDVTQTGAGVVTNYSIATQTGDDNKLTVNQSGPNSSFNTSVAVQNGNGNTASVTQH